MNSIFNVINFHLTEKCNYSCSYCFAKFNTDGELKFEEWKKAADIISSYFQRNKVTNGRINLAGGEPMVLSYLDDLIEYIFSLGMDVSIITNASFLTKEKIDKWANKVSQLGISIDSLNFETNTIIGRSAGKKVINIDNLVDNLNYAKSLGIKLKVNTVVSKLNLNENLLPLYERVQFARIKLLQVVINQNCNEKAFESKISAEEFEEYCAKIPNKYNLVIESEHEIESSYIFIDPKGNLISNKSKNHLSVGSIFSIKLEDLITKCAVDKDKFQKRYLKKI